MYIPIDEWLTRPSVRLLRYLRRQTAPQSTTDILDALDVSDAYDRKVYNTALHELVKRGRATKTRITWRDPLLKAPCSGYVFGPTRQGSAWLESMLAPPTDIEDPDKIDGRSRAAKLQRAARG